MLNEADIINVASMYLDAYRAVLVIDPLLRFSVRPVSSGPTSRLVKDNTSKLSWFLELNIHQHNSAEDVRDSVIDFLSEMLVSDIDLLEGNLVKEIKERISCRLFCALQNVLPDIQEEEQ